MIEIPEARALANQINEHLTGKKISNVMTEQSVHKFAWYHGDPKDYGPLLTGRVITGGEAYGGLVEINAGQVTILVGDGVNLRYHDAGAAGPKKHQLLLEFEDGSALSASVQMYGGIWCFPVDTFKNPYYLVAKEKPSPLTHEFDRPYFSRILEAEGCGKLSTKAFLVTEQRIPGLGNGVLQDILWNARLHPRRKMNSLEEYEIENLFAALKETLKKMSELRGRDTEKDLFGNAGGYRTVMSKNNQEAICPQCGKDITKENYLGGSIYYCSACQSCQENN